MATANAAILVVEDEAALARGYRRGLERRGFSVQVAPDLASARELLKENDFAGVVLDLRLPDGSGQSLIQDIDGMVQQPRVVVASGAVDSDVAAELGVAGVIALPKPASIRAILRVLDAPRRGQYRETVRSFTERYRLSPKESRVVMWACDGLDRDELAKEMQCAPRTVLSYWQRIFLKTGCSSQREVLAIVFRESFQHSDPASGDESDAAGADS